MKAVYLLHAVSWLAIFIAVTALFYSLTTFGVSAAIAAATWIAGDLAGRHA